MNKKIFFAVTGVMFGISLFLWGCIILTQKLGIANIYEMLHRMPTWVIIWVGVANVVTFVPIFISGVYWLKPKGAIGQSDTLITKGIYKYLRNPFYAGVSFTLLGVGLIINQTGVSLAGLIWLCICLIQSKREEVELTHRFGREYTDYQRRTPRFIPRFQYLIKNLLFNSN